jgi:hypothetical protein
MHITDEEQAAFDNATECNICNQLPIKRKMCDSDMDYARFETSGTTPIRDHCHITGKYRGAAHTLCDQQHQVPEFYPVVIHSFSGCDAHYS